MEELHGTPSLTFKVGDGEFGDHFKGKSIKSAGSKKETLKAHKVKVRCHRNKCFILVDIKKQTVGLFVGSGSI